MTRCPDCILNDVARAFGVDKSDMLSQSKKARYARPRFAAMRMIRQERGVSLQMIARLLKRIDHQTIISGIERADEMLGTDPDFAMKYEAAR